MRLIGFFCFSLFAFQEQYFFIHDALKESLECGNTEILAKDLPAAIKSLHQPSLTDDTVTAIEAEYQVRPEYDVVCLCNTCACGRAITTGSF